MAARAAIYEDEDDDPLLSPSTPVHHTQKRSFFCEVVGEEVLSLLQWSMLAACTIGPGTVVVCTPSNSTPPCPQTFATKHPTRKTGLKQSPPPSVLTPTIAKGDC